MLVVFVFLVFRNAGLHPSIFADEWSYSLGSRLAKLKTASTPLYIYFWVYRLTRHCGSDFLNCARTLNDIFFVAATPLIYLVAGKVTSRPIAVFVALLSIIGPINTYTAYFMPEAMYFFVFWLMTWFIFRDRQASPGHYGSVIGALVAILILVKVNAVFLLPGIAAFLIYNAFEDKSSPRIKKSLVTLCYMVIAFAIVRFGIGYLAAGKAGLNLLGTKYGSLAGSSLTPSRFAEMTGEIFGILRGHVMGLALLFGMPLAMIATAGIRRAGDTEDDHTLRAIELYSLALIVPLLLAVAYFTASVFGTSPYESLARLHARYYNFLFPLFLIIVAGQFSAKETRRSTYGAVLAAVALIGFILYSFRSLLHLYSPSLIDSPELYGVTAGRIVLNVVGTLGIASIVAWVISRRCGAWLFLFVFAPVSVLWSAANANTELRQRLPADVYDKAGAFVHEDLDADERSKLIVVGSETASLYRVLFYVDDPQATLSTIPEGAPLDRDMIPDDREWVLLMGDHAVPAGVVDQISRDGYVLFKMPARTTDQRTGQTGRTIDFRHPFRFGVVKRVSGLSVPQLFGRWSDSREVQIEMWSPLPRSFDLKLKAYAFGPNTQLPFTVRIGQQTRTFRLSSSPGYISLPFTTDGSEKLITIEVPQPTSPRELGLSSDSRTLGIALTEASIIPRQ